MEQELLREFHALGVKELQAVTQLHALPGDYINLLCRLPGGQVMQVLQNDKTYLGAQVCKETDGRCYGLAADENQLLVFEYGDGGSDAELILWKKRGGNGI